MSRFQFVADHRDTFEVRQLCETIEINRSSFYVWEMAAPGRAERAASDAALAERIEVFHQADKAYGAPRITADLNAVHFYNHEDDIQQITTALTER